MFTELMKILCLLALLVMAGCAGNISRESADTLNDLEAAVKVKPEDHILVGKLGDANYRAYEESRNVYYLDRTIDQYRRLVELVPDNITYRAVLYLRLSEETLLTRNSGKFDELHRLYNEEPRLNETKVLPPSFVEALLVPRYRQNIRDKEYMALLRNAIKENSKHASPYIKLGIAFLEGNKNELAVAALTKAYDLGTGNKAAALLLADLLMESAVVDGCVADKEPIHKSVKILTSLLKHDPDNQAALDILITAYRRLGNYSLSLYAVRRYNKLSHDPDGPGEELIGLAFDGQIKEALQQYDGLVDGRDNIDYDLQDIHARILFASEHEREALKALKESIKMENDFSVYSRVRAALLIERLESVEARNKYLDAHDRTGKDLDIWQQLLLDYVSEKITDKNLLSNANNACQKGEALFYSGYRALTNKKIEIAKKDFQDVIDLGMSADWETVYAEEYMKRLEQ